MNEADKGKTTLTEGMKATTTGPAAGYREPPCHDCYCWQGKCTRSKRLWDQCVWKSDHGLFVPRPKLEPELWQVEISLGGQSILTISHNHLGGLNNISDYEEVIEKCADHLLAFIGKSR